MPQVHVAGGTHIVENAERAEETDVLKCPCDAAGGDAIRAVTDDGLARKRDLARGRPVDSGDQVEDGGFSRAVRADETDQLAVADRERKIRDAPQTSELHRHRIQLKQGVILMPIFASNFQPRRILADV